MPEETAQLPNSTLTPQSEKGFSFSLIIILIFLFGLLVIGGYIFWRMYGFGWGERDVDISETATSKTGASKITTKTDPQIIGIWESECLVPDQKSPWAEKHQFAIKSDGTAVHIRWSNDNSTHNCSNPTMTLTDNYTFKIPASDQIDLYNSKEGETIHDIYKISGNILLFGHGFRNNLVYPKNYGETPSMRIESLNNYIVYKKK